MKPDLVFVSYLRCCCFPSAAWLLMLWGRNGFYRPRFLSSLLGIATSAPPFRRSKRVFSVPVRFEANRFAACGDFLPPVLRYLRLRSQLPNRSTLPPLHTRSIRGWPARGSWSVNAVELPSVLLFAARERGSNCFSSVCFFCITPLRFTWRNTSSVRCTCWEGFAFRFAQSNSHPAFVFAHSWLVPCCCLAWSAFSASRAVFFRFMGWFVCFAAISNFVLVCMFWSEILVAFHIEWTSFVVSSVALK